LAAGALVLLGDATLTFVRNLVDGTLPVSFREHALIPEPFLVVGLIVGAHEPTQASVFLGPAEWAA
jgi:hypothetical protein